MATALKIASASRVTSRVLERTGTNEFGIERRFLWEVPHDTAVTVPELEPHTFTSRRTQHTFEATVCSTVRYDKDPYHDSPVWALGWIGTPWDPKEFDWSCPPDDPKARRFWEEIIARALSRD